MSAKQEEKVSASSKQTAPSEANTAPPKQPDAKSVKSNAKTLQSTGTVRSQRSEINSLATRIFSEQVRKEAICRDSFDNNLHLLKKSRNPLAGDLTARDDAEYLIPHKLRTRLKEDRERVLSNAALSVISSSSGSGKRKGFGLYNTFKEESDDATYLSEESRGSPVRHMRFKGMDDIKKRKDSLEMELEQLERVVEYKQKWLLNSYQKHSMNKRSKEEL